MGFFIICDLGLGPFSCLRYMKSESIKTLLSGVVESLGYELWGCEYLPQGRHSLLRVYIDSPKGIQIDDCERVSEQVSRVLDVEDVISGQYSLEISSPGLDRPLFEKEHYKRYVGSEVSLKLKHPVGEKKKYIGVISGLEQDVLQLKVGEELVSMPLDVITKANIVS